MEVVSTIYLVALKVLKSKLTPWIALLAAALLLVSLNQRLHKAKNSVDRLTKNSMVQLNQIAIGDSIRGAETKSFRLTIDEMRSSQMEYRNAYSKVLYEHKKLLESRGLRIKDLELALSASVVSSDTTRSEPLTPKEKERPDSCTYKFFTKTDSSWVLVSKGSAIKISRYYISAKLQVTVSANRRKNGKKHLIFPNSKWLWGSSKSYAIVVNLPNASVNELTVIEKSNDNP